MPHEEDATVLLAVVPSELEASLIVAALEGDGIVAQASGGMASGFRAEAPGGVRILVRASDRERALEILLSETPELGDEPRLLPEARPKRLRAGSGDEVPISISPEGVG